MHPLGPLPVPAEGLDGGGHQGDVLVRLDPGGVLGLELGVDEVGVDVPCRNFAFCMTRAWNGMVVLMPFTEYSDRARVMRVMQRSRVLPQTTSLLSMGS